MDFSLTLPDGVRLRANLFRQRCGLSLALRLIASHCPPLGAVLIVGATGSDKSTTLAVLIAAMNQRRRRHILTLEDPFEFLHSSAQSLIQQREMGQHFTRFADGLRDVETIQLALRQGT